MIVESRRVVLAAALVILSSGPQLGIARGDVQVNTYTTSQQASPAVSLAADSDFVVVWHSVGSGGTDSLGYSVQGQRYASDGSAVGVEFQINTYTTSTQINASVAVDTDGDFVVAWNSYGSDGPDSEFYSVQARRYTSGGSSIGVEFEVNTYTTSTQVKTTLALEPDGDFVVGWHSYGSAGTDSSASSVQAQRYLADGSPVGGQFQINTYTSLAQVDTSVDLDASGNLVIVWTSAGSFGTDTLSASVQKSDSGLVVPVELISFRVD